MAAKRSQQLLERLIVVGVYIFISYTWYLCIVEVSGCLLWRKRRIYAIAYGLLMSSIMSFTTFCYRHLTRGLQSHTVSPVQIPDRSSILLPYQCINKNGDLGTCLKGSCAGSWKPPRTHHCSVCGACRLEFDHHCPWIGNCITLKEMKMFLSLLLTVPVAFAIGTSPVSRLLRYQLLEALMTSKADVSIQQIWWSRKYSWAFGGPIGRYFIGTAFGLQALREKLQISPSSCALEVPRIRIQLAAIMACTISIFSVILAIKTSQQLLSGLTSLEALAPRGLVKSNRDGWTFVCIPDSPTPGDSSPAGSSPTVIPIPLGRHPYDLGPWSNFISFWNRSFVPSNDERKNYAWPPINPTLLQELRPKVE